MVFLFALAQTFFGQVVMVNTYHFDGINTDLEAEMVGDKLVDQYITRLYPDMPAGVVFNGYSRRRVDLPDYPTVTKGYSQGATGQNGEVQGLPPTNAVVASWTGPSQRPNRTRKYFGGYVESAQANGVWGVGVIDRVNLFMEDLQEMAELVDLEVAMVSFRLRTQVPYDYVANPVTAYSVSPLVATMRSRRIGSGI